MNKKKKKLNKKILVVVGIVILIISIITIFICYQVKWKGYKTYKTDLFSIKYIEQWEVKDEVSDTGDVKNFTDNGKNSVRVISVPKAEMPENQNTLEKFKDNMLQQMKDSVANLFFNGEPNTEYIGNNGVKITYQYKTGEYLIYVMYEKKDNFYSIVFQGDNIEIFNKMEKSLKIK